MQYLALLISQERDLTPEQGADEMAAYQSFHAKAASAIRVNEPKQIVRVHRQGVADLNSAQLPTSKPGHHDGLFNRGMRLRRGVGN